MYEFHYKAVVYESMSITQYGIRVREGKHIDLILEIFGWAPFLLHVYSTVSCIFD